MKELVIAPRSSYFGKSTQPLGPFVPLAMSIVIVIEFQLSMCVSSKFLLLLCFYRVSRKTEFYQIVKLHIGAPSATGNPTLKIAFGRF